MNFPMRVPSLTDDDPQLGPAVRAERNRMLFAHTASICTVSLIVSMVVGSSPCSLKQASAPSRMRRLSCERAPG
mgnify:CR=1 FL=1